MSFSRDSYVEKILIVDDEVSFRKMLSKMIKDESNEIFVAENGSQAKQLCIEHDIDLLITDIVMPEKHGIDLILEIKEELPDLPIIAISGGGGITGRFDYLEIAKLVGANNILRKPFESSEIISLVKGAFEK